MRIEKLLKVSFDGPSDILAGAKQRVHVVRRAAYGFGDLPCGEPGIMTLGEELEESRFDGSRSDSISRPGHRTWF